MRRRDAPSRYLRTKGEGRGRRCRIRVWPGRIFRPSVIFGREDSLSQPVRRAASASLPVMALACAERALPAGLRRRCRRAFAARAGRRCARTAGAIRLCGPRVYTLRELVAYVGELHRLSPSASLPLGATLSKLQAAVLELLPGKLMSRDNLASMQLPSVCDCGCARASARRRAALEAIAPDYISAPSQRDSLSRMRSRTAGTPPMKVYRVGGSVRDELLGRAGRRSRLRRRRRDARGDDRAGVSSGRQGLPGLSAPADAARSTRSRGPSARAGAGTAASSFHAAPDVTLEAGSRATRSHDQRDGARRATATLIDPYGGAADLARRVLRHVAPAFAEDPLARAARRALRGRGSGSPLRRRPTR